jgi:hypothetical protein
LVWPICLLKKTCDFSTLIQGHSQEKCRGDGYKPFEALASLSPEGDQTLAASFPPPPSLPLAAAREGRRQAARLTVTATARCIPAAFPGWGFGRWGGGPGRRTRGWLSGELHGEGVGGAPWSCGRRGVQRREVLAGGVFFILSAQIQIWRPLSWRGDGGRRSWRGVEIASRESSPRPMSVPAMVTL